MPYRRNEAGEVEVLLLTSRTRRRWIIPKGWPIKGLKPAKSAAREAFEEAGVRGVVSGKALGRFTYNKLLDEDGRAVICEVAVFPLAVRRQLKVWPEIEQREIRWVAVSEAAALTDEDGLRPLLEAFSAKMEAKRKPASERGVGIAGAIPTRPHHCEAVVSFSSEAISASGALNRPRRSSGGTTASTASSFSLGSMRR